MRLVQQTLLLTALFLALTHWFGGRQEKELRFDFDLGTFSALLSFHPAASAN